MTLSALLDQAGNIATKVTAGVQTVQQLSQTFNAMTNNGSAASVAKPAGDYQKSAITGGMPVWVWVVVGVVGVVVLFGKKLKRLFR